MKYILSLIVLLSVFISCQKEITGEIFSSPNDTTIGGPLQGTFKAKIGGVQFIADKGASAGISTASPLLPSLINITGMNNNNKTITITLENRGKGTYNIYDTSFAAGAYTGDSSSSLSYTTNQGPAGLAGKVEITTLDTVRKIISGTFSFKVYRQSDSSVINITDGEFTNVPLVVGNVLPPAPSTDTFRVKINDTLFIPYSVNGNLVTTPGVGSIIAIQGSDSLITKTVAVTVPSNTTPGTYDMDIINYNGAYNNGSLTTMPDSGRVQILEHNVSSKRIRGRFNFLAKQMFTPTVVGRLTEGYFSVVYK